jgi:hypothetical protein
LRNGSQIQQGIVVLSAIKTDLFVGNLMRNMVVALAGSAAKLSKGSGASVHLAEEGGMECTRCFRVYEMGFMHLVVRRIMYVCFPVIIITSFPISQI